MVENKIRKKKIFPSEKLFKKKKKKKKKAYRMMLMVSRE